MYFEKPENQAIYLEQAETIAPTIPHLRDLLVWLSGTEFVCCEVSEFVWRHGGGCVDFYNGAPHQQQLEVFQVPPVPLILLAVMVALEFHDW